MKNVADLASISVDGGATDQQSKIRTLQSSMDEEDELELKDMKHMPKEQITEATYAIFNAKVKELTFPKNPSLFTKEQEACSVLRSPKRHASPSNQGFMRSFDGLPVH